jgi:hypothetical protein
MLKEQIKIIQVRRVITMPAEGRISLTKTNGFSNPNRGNISRVVINGVLSPSIIHGPLYFNQRKDFFSQNCGATD